eukprot:TRINITY_DN45484_c0_g1_i1.p1 TRINITY_DN45484_c0_g1~~TRINITY_DN45484_c0_g1_i1.p1  ORF type:complete len:449 (+),score=160.72 TRINITY_DN45484_c0_g1_i1:49-1395(+)
MEWFDGGVGEAIAAAKAKKAIFAVFVKGKSDEETTIKLTEILEDLEVVSALSSMVCISVENGTNTCLQFSSIYPVILVPSVYFIDSNTGVDLEITGGIVTKESLMASINKALEKVGEAADIVQAAPVASAAPVTVSETSTTTTEIGTNEAVEESKVEAISSNASGEQSKALEERVEKAKLLMAQRQAEREAQEKEKEKDKEKERREVGKALLERKRTQEEQDLKEAAMARRKDKDEEKKAKEAVKAAIEQDRLDRKMKYDVEKKANDEKRKENEKAALAAQAAVAEKTASDRATVARIQFRLPDGSSQTKQFPAETPLSEVYDFVSTGLETQFSSFSLSTTFPRRILDQEEKTISLKQLQMAPSATILVLPLGGLVSQQDGGLMSLIWLILTPFTVLWAMLSSLFGSAPSGSQPPPSSSRREGGIGRLRTDRDDGENNTWNGNSTQQK